MILKQFLSSGGTKTCDCDNRHTRPKTTIKLSWLDVQLSFSVFGIATYSYQPPHHTSLQDNMEQIVERPD